MGSAETKPVERDAAQHGVHVDISGAVSTDVRKWLEDYSERGLRSLAARGEVRVRVVDDAVMAAAHEGFAGVAGTTDVLTFDLAESGAGAGGSGILDVDILVCVDEAARQGAARGHGVERELLLYIIHGVLHCLGHDDHDEVAAARMHAEEDRVLELLGVGATSAPRGVHRGGDR